MARNNVYDMMRERAKAMGHAAANLPDAVWEKYAAADARKQNLLSAKLYMENYMMGNLDPSEFAEVMAQDDALRYTISDLCRIRLEPVTPDIQRNDSYIDVGAGIKTFWTEIRVPLPSEREAARDLRNISLGIEAGRRTAGVFSEAQAPEIDKKPGRRSFRDVLSSAKQRAAEIAIEKLTPIAQGDKGEPVLDESWLETEEGREYKDNYTRKAAQQVENVVMNIEAGREQSLEPAERAKAFEAAGMESGKAQVHAQVMTPAEYVLDMEKQIEDAYHNGGFKEQPRTLTELQETREYIPTDEYYKDLYKNYVMQSAGEKIEPEITVADLNQWRDQLKNEYSKVSKLAQRSGYDRKELNATTDQDFVKILDDAIKREGQPGQKPEELRSGYSMDELNGTTDDQMKDLMDQIMQHVNQDNMASPRRPFQNNQHRQENGQQQSKGKDDNKIRGIYEGKEVAFKNSWSTHTFTDEEAQKLLNGESITFEYAKNGQTKTASGKLEWQQYEGREYLGFKADFSKKNTQAASNELFTEQDQSMMEYYMGGTQATDQDMDDYYSRLAADMDGYQSEGGIPIEGPGEEELELSADDVARLFDNQDGMHM